MPRYKNASPAARKKNAGTKGKKQNKRSGRLGRTVLFLCFTVIFALLLMQWIEQEKILRRQEARLAELEEQYLGIVSQIDDINREIELADSPSYIEHYLREKLGMIKRGEIMYKVEINEPEQDG